MTLWESALFTVCTSRIAPPYIIHGLCASFASITVYAPVSGRLTPVDCTLLCQPLNSQFAFTVYVPSSKFQGNFRKRLDRKILVSIKCFVRNSGAGNGCTNFMGAWKNAFFLQKKTHAHQIPRFFGGVFWALAGGECRFYFYGREDFSDLDKLRFKFAPFLEASLSRRAMVTLYAFASIFFLLCFARTSYASILLQLRRWRRTSLNQEYKWSCTSDAATPQKIRCGNRRTKVACVRGWGGGTLRAEKLTF